MKQGKKLRIVYGVFVVFMMGMIIYLSMNSGQAVRAMLLPLVYEGEYSYGDGNWFPLNGKENFNSIKGDLWVRISPERDLEEGEVLTFYLEYIGIDVTVNGGEKISMGPTEEYWLKYMCGNFWYTWECGGIAQEDVIEIHFSNPLQYGNPKAYHNLLDSIYTTNQEAVKVYLEKETFKYRAMGVFIIVSSVALLGAAVGYGIVNETESNWLLNMGVMSMFMGIYILHDTVDIFLRQEIIAVNTYLKDFSVIFAAYGLSYAMMCLLHGKRAYWGRLVVNVLCLADVVVLIMATIGGALISSLMQYWALVQGITGVLLFVFIIAEIINNKEKVLLLYSGMILSGVMVVELINGYAGLWQCGLVIKDVFAVLYVLHFIVAIRIIIVNFREAKEKEYIKKELANSKIVLAMSQIRTHFIFNVLNAISGMCSYNPEKADEALVQFSRYLRKHLHIMERDEEESFQKTIEHLEDYIGLEQLRFGNKIRFRKNIMEENFKIPPLIIQPIVENAIQHGILKKKEGGTIVLETYRDGENIVVKISDDGVGYMLKDAECDDAIGLRNVRFRLKYMLNGEMDIKSVPGEGTVVTLTIPVQNTYDGGAE